MEKSNLSQGSVKHYQFREDSMRHSNGTSVRWNEISEIWKAKENQWLYALVGLLAGFLLSSSLQFETEFLASIFPEALGIFFTVLVIDRLNENRAKREFKQQLIRQLRSPDNGYALVALEELQARDALYDGSLRNAFLASANLKKAKFSQKSKTPEEKFFFGLTDLDSSLHPEVKGCDLRGANLRKANLSETVLARGDLKEVNLVAANLQKADLTQANLSGSNLRNADLRGASLNGSDLSDTMLALADFRGANLEGAYMVGADVKGIKLSKEMMLLEVAGVIYQDFPKFDENTVLPDGSKWSPNVDIMRFTDTTHSNAHEYVWPHKEHIVKHFSGHGVL